MKNKLKFVKGNAEVLAFKDNTFDRIVVTCVMAHVDDVLAALFEMKRVAKRVAEIGILPFISIMAYISISLGLINLFPIPMLDGGHLMFYAFEKVLGRPLSQKVQEGFFRIGMFLLLSLMFFTTFNDLKDLGLFN